MKFHRFHATGENPGDSYEDVLSFSLLGLVGVGVWFILYPFLNIHLLFIALTNSQAVK